MDINIEYLKFRITTIIVIGLSLIGFGIIIYVLSSLW